MPTRSHTFGLVMATFVAAAVTGCTATSSTSSAESPDTSFTLSRPPQSTPAARVAPDYRRLLIEPGDINTGTDTSRPARQPPALAEQMVLRLFSSTKTTPGRSATPS